MKRIKLRHAILYATLASAVLFAGCATNNTVGREWPQACVTELPGLAAYAQENCRACENVHFAAPGEPWRCGRSGRRPGGEADTDTDNDGVVDRQDACPGTPAGVEVLGNGCERIELEGVTFPLDSARLRSDARDALERQLGVLTRSPDVRVEIAGHTDDQGASDYNRQLSLRRARAVRAFFVDQGIDSARLKVQGYGESQPIASNEDAAGRERNRRVELRVLGR
jgi:outer membrane protein OmpA-like peptidoglycan-associated protein